MYEEGGGGEEVEATVVEASSEVIEKERSEGYGRGPARMIFSSE